MPRPLLSAPLVMNHVTQLCRCGKVYGLDEQDARRIVRRIQKRKGTDERLRFYQCSYSGWHWTRNLERRAA